MEIEQQLLLEQMTAKKEITLANHIILTEGLLDGKAFSLLLCGIGKVNAALSCALAINQTKPDLVVNSGIAGGLLASQQLADIVISYQAAYHDVDVTAFGYSYGQLPKSPLIYEGDAKAAGFLQEAANSYGYRANVGLVVSGDQFVNNTTQVKTILNHFPAAEAVEMEAAAIAHSCTNLNTPFVIIRSLSDKADSNAKHDYGRFAKEASERSAKLVRTLVNR